MKKLFSIAVILMIAANLQPVVAQPLSPRPALPTEGKGMIFFYKPVNGLYENMKIEKVAVAGAFNGWDNMKNPMSLNAATGIWSGTARLEAGQEYHYKFVLNDSLWITDPNAPAVTQDDWRNGIIVGIEQGKPYISGFRPVRNQLLKKIQPLSARLVSEKGIDAKSVALKINGMPQAFTVRGDSLFSPLADTLPDREYITELAFTDTLGTASAKFSTSFILDRTEPKIETPEFYRGAVMYEIFVRKFFDTNGDGIGDLNGVTAKLDYIQSLGANVIWLMPINKAPSEHGYNVSDYLAVQPELGTTQDFKRLLAEAHRRKMKVLMDLVINHSDSTHPYFLDAYRNPKSRYSDWFQFTEKDNSDWEHFGGSRYMPKINFFNKEAEDWVVSIALYWQAFGV
ncbi:MAG: hypothetical protein IAF08_16875, partial [Rhizobacter sp.]|nr:hypothetical protein [Chlorobiales bacterium]